MIMHGPKTQVHPHPYVLGAPTFVRPALRLDEVDQMEESRARFVERIESSARKFHEWMWSDDADTRSKVFGYSVVVIVVCMVVVAALR